jgi:NADH:ubiquinone oxidoreductase subunit E
MECLAACDKAPMMFINETLYTHLTEEKLDQILQELPA